MAQTRAKTILIVDDDSVTCDLLCEVFEREGFEANSAQSGEAALSMLKTLEVDVLVSDIRMKTKLDGLSLLDHVRRDHSTIPVVLMTAFGSIETAIRAVKHGAFEYLSKPFDIDKMVATVERAVASRSAPSPGSSDHETDVFETGSVLVGRSPAMLEIYKIIARVSDSSASVLITGESGTGKELISRAIHTHGNRQHAPFVAVNCGALTETLLESELFGHVKGAFTGAISNKRGLFEQAGDGTLFLDEISETSSGLQIKLLRVLQEREVVPVGGDIATRVGARVIAASNNDIELLSTTGAFRLDLFYRLNVIHIHVPALRDRTDDIPLLAKHLVRKHTAPGQVEATITDEVFRKLVEYSWPGNVRELENVIERAITLTQTARLTVTDLPARVSQNQTPFPVIVQKDELAKLFDGLPSVDELERRYLLHVLEATGGNRKRAAEIMGINRRTLYRMAERLQQEI
ncbi:MAG: two-component system, NtrC family, response regulator AtoC [Blastocatellia bacterium]|nr:two-component system, NtrC family, response regulator AtoC [Blastocatellia bacterium]